jgi:hypothetical protein
MVHTQNQFKMGRSNTVIRKISIGTEYKDNAMHYYVGQPAWDNHIVHTIQFIDEDQSHIIWLEKSGEIMMWKKFNKNMAIAVEYDLTY